VGRYGVSKSKLTAESDGTNVFRVPLFGFTNIEFVRFAEQGVARAQEVGKLVRKQALKVFVRAS
jgi:hypothetical protein